MKFIGITGGVGAGKSEILKYIKRHYKCEIYLADEAAHEVKKAGTECFDRLVTLLGCDIVGEDGEINKAVMADKIFGDEELLRQVNEIVHPAVKDYLMAKYEAAMENPKLELFFVEAALLIEAGYKELVDEMWYIYADRNVRRRRLMYSRGYSEEKIQNIMDNQLTEEEFRNACDFVIDNSGLLADSYRQIDEKLEAFTWQE
ncbi:MAG: dephospho-CoA kinase [Lachnospiraceae bacterium]|nr:dephospho-CoA kinase [Lachnospiraceae bacterium]